LEKRKKKGSPLNNTPRGVHWVCRLGKKRGRKQNRKEENQEKGESRH